MGAEREMTLEEWVARLPEFHLAHRQYTEMRENTDKLAAEIVRLRGEVAALLEDPDEAELAYRCGDPDSDDIAPAEAKGDWFGDVLASMGEVVPLAPQPAEVKGVCSCPEHGSWIAADDILRNVRELDVALNGEEGAAQQAMLCDIVAQVKRHARLHGPVFGTPQPADGELGAALYGMFRALVDAGGATTVARHGAMPRPEKLMDALTRGMLAIERMFHPERFELDEFPRTAARPPAPVQAAPQEGEASRELAAARAEVTTTALAWGRNLVEGGADGGKASAFDDAVERLERAVLAANPSACELGAVLKEIRAAADSGGANEGQCYNWWRKFEAALQHRGDSRGGEG